MLTPFLHRLVPKIVIFKRFYQFFYRIIELQHKSLILIEYPNIFYWKLTKKGKWVWSLGQNQKQIRSNVVKSTKMLALLLDFFRIMQEEHI